MQTSSPFSFSHAIDGSLKGTPHVRILAILALLASSRVAAPQPVRADPFGSDTPIPGPRTCFWYRGPHNTDPYINVAYPDEGAFYWSAVVTVPAGATLKLKGQFPHARYMSFVSYRENGQVVESLADNQISADAGSINPFHQGANRKAKKRGYTITVEARADDKESGDGRLTAGDGRNILRAPQLGAGQMSILYRIYVNDLAHPVNGGEIYPNPDNRNARAFVSTKFAPVLLLTGKMPAVPSTWNGDATMGQGRLRYWSLCSNMVMINSRTIDCVFDEQVPLDAERNYTIVASKAKDRPRNARTECGIAWIDLPEDGDGMGDEDFSLLVVRNMLADPAFPEALQNMLDDRDLAKMDPYLPTGRYVMPNAVESLMPCPLGQ